ncbi:MAG: sulfur carrier protein ThiS [Megasphaera micronuciformis]|nr:sulfur carrier protein ThiS [Megasphaera micronuciformis]
MIIVNGQGIDEKSLKLSHWLLLNDYDRDLIAVERNGSIVKRNDYDKTVLQDGDTVEIVQFVGGG